MASEALHLSALTDCRNAPVLAEDLRDFLSGPEAYTAARLGAVMIDLPYFRGLLLKAARFVLRLPQSPSAWGDRYHRARPVGFGQALLKASHQLEQPELRERLLAFTLGYFTHIALDTETHIHVNRMARERAAIAGSAADHHQSIEKMQSLFFHRDRLGYDTLGRPEMREYLSVEIGGLLDSSVLFQAWQKAHASTFALVPSAKELQAWFHGYRQYAWLASHSISKHAITEDERQREYPLVYQGPNFSFPAVYEAAIDRCLRYLQVAWRASKGQPFDENAIPERNLDEPDPQRFRS